MPNTKGVADIHSSILATVYYRQQFVDFQCGCGFNKSFNMCSAPASNLDAFHNLGGTCPLCNTDCLKRLASAKLYSVNTSLGPCAQLQLFQFPRVQTSLGVTNTLGITIHMLNLRVRNLMAMTQEDLSAGGYMSPYFLPSFIMQPLINSAETCFQMHICTPLHSAHHHAQA